MKKLVVLLCWLLAACNQKVETTHPALENITESVYASGKTKSQGQYEIYAPVNGIIAQINVKEGDVVKKGDVLLTLMAEVPQLNQENASIAAHYQSVQANRGKLNEAQIAINQARSKMQNDSLLLTRQRNLWKEEIGTRNQLDDRELAARNSTLSYQTALLNYKQLQQGVEFADRQSKKNLQISTTLSGDYSIRAKRDGKVYAINKEVGEAVNPQTAIGVVGAAQNFYLELQVDEYDIAKISPGQKVVVTMDSYKGQVFEGTVTKIDPYVNDRSRSGTIEASFTKSPSTLFPNFTAEANVLIRAKANTLTIPRSYLVDETYVVLQSGEKRKITTGLKDYKKVEVISGLSKDDVIQKPVD